MTGTARQPGNDVKGGIDGGALNGVEIGLRIVGPPVDEPERPGRRAQGDGLDAAAREGGDMTERPGRAEKPALARVDAGQADATALRIVQRVLAIGVLAATDGARPDAISGGAGERPGRAMIAGSASSVSITERSSAACTIGQVVWVTKSSSSAGGRLRLSSVKYEKTPPPSRAPGKAARAAAQIAEAGGTSSPLRPADARQVRGRRHGNDGGREAGRGDGFGDRLQLGNGGSRPGDDDLDPQFGAGRLGDVAKAASVAGSSGSRPSI